jgi:hypothetical protein
MWNMCTGEGNRKQGAETLAGRLLYKFTVTPRRKRPELFKGEILLDPWTGHIVRAGGRLSKSPSWWIKRIDFTEDYADVGDFTMPVQISSVTEARIIGRVAATIRHRAYEVRSIDQVQAEGRLTLGTAAIRQSRGEVSDHLLVDGFSFSAILTRSQGNPIDSLRQDECRV